MARGVYSTSNYLRSTATPITGTPMTLACWAYQVTSANWERSLINVCRSYNSHNQWRLSAGYSSYRVVAIANDTTQTSYASSATDIPANAWFHAAAVFSSSTSRYAYLNGVPGTQNTTSRAPTGVNRIGLGINGSSLVGNASDNQYIAEACIYGTALSTGEIEQLARGYSPLLVRPQDLVAYWPLVRGDGSGNEPDVIGGYTLTETGTVGVQTHVPKLILPRRSQRYMWAPAPTFSPRWVRSSHIISAGVQHA